MTAAQDSRAQFEAWHHAQIKPFMDRMDFDAVARMQANKAGDWATWQASRAALSAEPVAAGSMQRRAFIKGWDERGKAHELQGSEVTDRFMQQLLDVYYPRAAAPQPAAQERACDTPLYCLSVQRCTAMDEKRARGIAGQHST